MLHRPGRISVAVVPETVQTVGVIEAKLTVRPELDVALRVTGVPCTWLAMGANVIVWLRATPVPLSGMLCVAGLAFSELSVSVALLLIGPLAVGVKLMLRLQLAPGVSEKLLVQSAGVPEPADLRESSAPIAQSGSNGIQRLVADVLDRDRLRAVVLVLPTSVAAKLNDGGCERCTSTTRLL